MDVQQDNNEQENKKYLTKQRERESLIFDFEFSY